MDKEDIAFIVNYLGLGFWAMLIILAMFLGQVR